MQLGSLIWAMLMLTVVPVFLVLPAKLRTPMLVVASYVFYILGNPTDSLVLVALTVFVWFVGKRVRAAADAGERGNATARGWLTGGIVGLVATLGVYKYTAFVVGTLDAFIHRFTSLSPIPIPIIVAPLGISFITFMLIHYLVEMYRNEAPAPTFTQFALYASFFPTVTNGPIKRYPEFQRDIEAGPRVKPDEMAYGVGRIIVGLFKKFVIADAMNPLYLPLFTPHLHDWRVLLVGMYAYAFKIFFDFAGYSDIAIGSSKMLGFTIMENFDWPYIRRNLASFWDHWHMSLTRFITEYIFIPLGGSRRARWRVAVNTLVTMAISGLWHGAAWHFVAWGLYHGIGLVILRWYKELEGRLKTRFPVLERIARNKPFSWASYGLSMFVTFNFVAFGWMLFILPVSDAVYVWSTILRHVLHPAVDLVRAIAPGLIPLRGTA
jgi:alginate O-acetyltransferase complex protein AlgI